MPAAQDLVDRLRDALTARDQSITQELRDLATAYVELCRAVNDRIRRCGQLLRQGLKTEAVNLAEADPNLLDQLTALDFPERDARQQWCVQYGLAEPPPLDMESAGAINEAYTAVQPLEVLLAKHRRLALALAPLPLRLVVMREIAKADKSANFWADDIRTFEIARLGEIRQQWAMAAADRHLPGLLLNELSSGQWSVAIPGDLLRAVKERAGERRDQGRHIRVPGQFTPLHRVPDGRLQGCRIAALKFAVHGSDVGVALGGVEFVGVASYLTDAGIRLTLFI